MYVYLTFATPHQPSRGEYLREGQWEDLGTSRPKHLAWCSWTAVLFSRVWWGREWGSRRRQILDRPAHLTGGLLQPTSQIPGVGCTHKVRSPGSPPRGEDEPDNAQMPLVASINARGEARHFSAIYFRFETPPTPKSIGLQAKNVSRPKRSYPA